MSNVLRSMHSDPPHKDVGKFIALYNDGSGAGVFAMLDDGSVLSAEGEERASNIEGMQRSFSHWIDISNEDYRFWCELDIPENTTSKE